MPPSATALTTAADVQLAGRAGADDVVGVAGVDGAGRPAARRRARSGLPKSARPRGCAAEARGRYGRVTAPAAAPAVITAVTQPAPTSPPTSTAELRTCRMTGHASRAHKI